MDCRRRSLRERTSEGSALLTLLLCACGGAPEPGIVLADGVVRYGTHQLAIGAPFEAWTAVLGTPEDRSFDVVHWPDHRLLAHHQRSPCGGSFVTNIRVSLDHEDDPEYRPLNFGRPVQLEECIFERGEPLEGSRVHCGWNPFSMHLAQGRPFEFLYIDEAGGLSRSVMVYPDLRPRFIDYGLSSDNLDRMGLEVIGEAAESYRASGACEREESKRPELGTEGLQRTFRKLLPF